MSINNQNFSFQILSYDIMMSKNFQNFLDIFNNNTHSIDKLKNTYFNDQYNTSQIISSQIQDNIQLPIDVQKQIIWALEKTINIQKEAPRLTQSDLIKNPRKFSNTLLQSNPELLQLKQVLILQSHARRNYIQHKKLIYPSDNNKVDNIYYQRCKYYIDKERRKQGIPLIDCSTGRKFQNQMSVLSMHKRQDSNKQLDREVLLTYRQIIKDMLKDFNDEFKTRFGEEPSKNEKEVLRSLYTDYKNLKQFCSLEGNDTQIQQVTQQSSYLSQQHGQQNQLQYTHSRQSSLSSSTQFIQQPQQIQHQDSISQQIIQLQQYCGQAQKMLQIPIPQTVEETKVLKHQIQKFLQVYKNTYDKTTSRIVELRKQNKQIPINLKPDWNQQIASVYNQLYQVYKQLKQRCQ